jgi:hypothetical protein
MLKVTKVSRNIGLKVGSDVKGKDIFENVFLNVDVCAGTEIKLDEKEHKYVLDAVKRLLKAQAILKKAMENA